MNLTKLASDVAKLTRSYGNKKEYRALLSQAGTAAPTAVVLNSSEGNFLGTITWARTSAGLYTGTLLGKFLTGKVHIQLNDSSIAAANNNFGAQRTSDNVITIASRVGAVLTDALLNNVAIVVTVYN